MIKKTLSFLGKINFKTKLTLFVVLCLGSITFALTKPQALQNLLVMRASDYHYSQQDVDDTYSEKAFHLYIERLDPNKRFFTQEDIAELSIYKYAIDDHIESGNFVFLEQAYSIYMKRLAMINDYVPTLFDNQFSFNSDITLEVDPDKRNFVTNNDELKQYWQHLMEYQTLTRYINLKEADITKNETLDSSFNIEHEIEAREKTQNEITESLSRLKEEDLDDFRDLYFDSMINVFDTHTSYFPPARK